MTDCLYILMQREIPRKKGDQPGPWKPTLDAPELPGRLSWLEMRVGVINRNPRTQAAIFVVPPSALMPLEPPAAAPPASGGLFGVMP